MAEKQSENEPEKFSGSDRSELQSNDAQVIRQPKGNEVTEALNANPDQFPSVANLSIPNQEQIEPFQIICEGKTVAASRRVEQVEPAGNASFHEGLKALPEGATAEQIAQMQIDYINRKAASPEAAGTMPALKPGMMLEGRVEKSQSQAENNEYFERMAGFIIGSVQGVGAVAVGLADMADFAAYVLLEDRRAGLKIEQFCKSLATAVVAGGQLFNSAYDYLYDVGFEGDYSKPFSDIASLAVVLNDRWQQLPPREQERMKGELISQLIAGGFVGVTSAQALGKTKSYSEILDGIAKKGIERASQSTNKLVETIGKHVDDLLQPEYALPGGGKIKMRDLPKVTREELFNAMNMGRLGGSTAESVAIKLESYLLNPDHADGGPKAEFFRRALGFTRDNQEELARQLVFDDATAVFTKTTEWGDKYNQVIVVTGANGKQMPITCCWIKNSDGIVRLTTAVDLGGK